MPAPARTPEPTIRQDMQSCGGDFGGSGIVVIYPGGLESALMV